KDHLVVTIAEDTASGGEGYDTIDVTMDVGRFIQYQARATTPFRQYLAGTEDADRLNLNLAASSVFRDVVRPATGAIRTVAAGLGRVADFLQSEIPVISQLQPGTTFGSLIARAGG